MPALIVPELGAQATVNERQKPTRGDGHVLLRAHAAGVDAVERAIEGGRFLSFAEQVA